MAAVWEGSSPKDAYGELAKKFDKSPSAASYRARSTDASDIGSAMGFAGLGIAAAVAIPAFLKYQTRSVEAAINSAEREAELMEEMQREMEAEKQALEALEPPSPPSP